MSRLPPGREPLTGIATERSALMTGSPALTGGAVTAADLLAGNDDQRAYGTIDLDELPPSIGTAELPPYPIVSTSRGGHPCPPGLDVLVEPRFSLARLTLDIERQPHAAAALVGLLRSIEGLERVPAVSLESCCYAMLQASEGHQSWLNTRVAACSFSPGTLRVARRGELLALRIDRPQARNAIDADLRDALHEAFTLAALDPEIKLVRLTATGRAFGIGADLAEFGTTRDPATAHAIRMRTLPALALARYRGRFEAHVQGACVGAHLELAAFADRLTAERNAWFQLPELRMGLIPGAGGCVSVPRRIGRQRTALMVLSGRRIDACTALRWGLIDAIVDAPPGDEDGADEA